MIILLILFLYYSSNDEMRRIYVALFKSNTLRVVRVFLLYFGNSYSYLAEEKIVEPLVVSIVAKVLLLDGVAQSK